MNNVKTVDVAIREQYLRCPYCNLSNGGHKIRVPKSVGKYRIKMINNNILSFTCHKCGHIFKMVVIPEIYLWDKINKKEQEKFKIKHYKGGK